MALTDFLETEEQLDIVKAIGAAERCTSGEIRVHVEPKCSGDPMARAIAVFNKLKMFETAQRNGVLIYVAYKSHKFAIIGDKGINEIVPEGFWAEELKLLGDYLSTNNQCKGLCEVVKIIGERLSEYFPISADDVNEQSDEISYSAEGDD